MDAPALAACARCRQGRGAARLLRPALALTDSGCRPAAPVQTVAPVHDRLRVAAMCARPAVRPARAPQRLTTGADLGSPSMPSDGSTPARAVQHRRAFVEQKLRSRGVERPIPGRAASASDVGESAAVALHHGTRAGVQVAGARVYRGRPRAITSAIGPAPGNTSGSAR